MPVILSGGAEAPEPADPQPWAGVKGVQLVLGTAAAPVTGRENREAAERGG